MTDKFIQQQMYTRERGGIFHATDGYDTIAISEGLDKAFVKKYLHPFCMYHAPQTLTERGEKDASLYPEAVTIFQPETGELVIGQSVFVPADFTGQRSTFFMHNYIIPEGMKDDWIKQPSRLFQLNDFKTSYDIGLGKVLAERKAVGHGETDILSVKNDLLDVLGMTEVHFKQLLYAVMSSIAGKKKVFISLGVPVEQYSKYALQLLELIYLYLPYAHRRKLGALTFSSEPAGKNYLHVMFYEPGTLNVADRSIEKQFIFDFAGGGRISGVDIDGQEHEYLDFALHHFSESMRIDEFLTFAEMALSGLSGEQKLELASYYQLTAIYLTLTSSDLSLYQKNKIGFLHSLLKFSQAKIEAKPELVQLFLQLLAEEKLAADPRPALDYIGAVIAINKSMRCDEALTFILETLQYYQHDPLFDKLWKEIEQDKHCHEALLIFINEHPDYDVLLEPYLDKRFKQVVRIEDILNELKIMLGSPYLLSIEKFKTTAIKKAISAISNEKKPFKAVLAVSDFKIEHQTAPFPEFKNKLLANVKMALLRTMRLRDISTEDILSFGTIFPKKLNVIDLKDAKAKSNYQVTNVLYQLISSPSQAELINLKLLTVVEREQLRDVLLRILRNNPAPEQIPLLLIAFGSEANGVDYPGLFEHLVRHSNEKTMFAFIRGNARQVEIDPRYKWSLRKYLISSPKSIWKNKALRNELKTIKNSSLQKLLKDVETATASPFVKFLRRYGLKLGLAIVILGGVGGGTWFGLHQLFGEEAKPKVPKTSETAAAKKEDPAVDQKENLPISLAGFKHAGVGEDGQSFDITLEGTQVKKIYGQVQPNGAQSLFLTDNTNHQWQMDLNSNFNPSPFDKKGMLKEGFTLSSAEYDLTGDDIPEVIMAASNGTSETYVWVYSVDTGGLKQEESTFLTPIFTAKGQLDVKLKDKKLILPKDDQDIVYEYSSESKTFVEQKNN
ncbi:hypothetical protein ACFVSW_17820 [Neobacillus sp. NPDC058068]|uniref:GAP1-N2 domain-containing protein n=1 Tax=Neobacillus sp. NPDC058068 TaxID=3346325 RepID=UPI0036DC9377